MPKNKRNSIEINKNSNQNSQKTGETFKIEQREKSPEPKCCCIINCCNSNREVNGDNNNISETKPTTITTSTNITPNASLL